MNPFGRVFSFSNDKIIFNVQINHAERFYDGVAPEFCRAQRQSIVNANISIYIGTAMYIPLMLLYHTRMRLGEVLGLSWQDIDFAAKKITLRQQIRYLSKRGYFLRLRSVIRTQRN